MRVNLRIFSFGVRSCKMALPQIALSLLTCLLSVSIAQAELTVQDFRGSSLSLGNSVSYGTIDRSQDLSYNPFVNTGMILAPRYWMTPRMFVAGRLGIDRQWTQQDDTTYKNETRVSDLTLRVGNLLHRYDFGLLTFVGAGIRLPTSLFSQANTLNASANGTIALIQAISSWGSMSYSFNVAHNNFRYTTGEIETPRIGSCAATPDVADCAQFLNTGVRNAPWVTTHGFSFNYFPLSWLFFSTSVSLIESYLFPRGVDDSSVSYSAQEPTNKRYLISYSSEIDIQPTSWLIVAFMANTFNPQLAPNSSYYQPFFNRNTMFMVDLRFTLGVFRVAQSDDSSKKKKKKKKKG